MKRNFATKMNPSHRQGIGLLLGAVVLMWIIEIINLLLQHQLSHLGIKPRSISQLYGIILAPMLHWGLFHLIANTIPFLVLGFLVHQTKHLIYVSGFVWIVSGVLVWLFGRNAIHAGASGVILGYFGFLLSHAYFTRSVRSLLIALFTIIFYGGMFFSLLDFRSHISFEAHIFGFIAGIICARTLKKA